MNDLTLLAELLAATGATEPAPLSEEIPSGLPWEADSLWEFRSAEASPALEKLTKRVEREELFTKIFGSFEVQAEPPMQKQTSLHDLVSSGVERTIAEMDVDNLRKTLATATAPSGLQKRRQEFISQTVEKRSERLWDICAKATRKLESMGFNTERLNLDGLHRSMKIFVEDAILAA